MKVTINSIEYNANEGDRLLDIARRNHAHIGYFCGGNALCQTCYSRITEGPNFSAPLMRLSWRFFHPTSFRQAPGLHVRQPLKNPEP